MKDAIIDEKNRFIANLQGRLTEIEQKLQNIVMINENNKENFLNSKLLDIDEQIKIEKKKNRILIIAFIIFLIIII
jgi:pheromone shutdown protein TraB